MNEIKVFVNQYLSDLDIIFLGLLSKGAIAEQMSVSSFLVHPTDAENLPCIIIESLCSGLPVLSSNVNGNLELINKENGFMYEVKNLEDFYLKFIQMTNDYPYLNKGKIAKKAREKYSSLAVGKQIKNIYNKVLSC